VRTFLGVLLGIITALIVQVAGDSVANLLYPARVSSMIDRDALAQALATRPAGALVVSLIGYFAAGYAGAWVARRISGVDWTGRVPPAVITILALVLVTNFDIALWAEIGWVVAPVIGGRLAIRTPARRSVRRDEDVAKV
jgi:hypothetical protein